MYHFVLQCSYSVCLKNQEDNEKAVEEYTKDWMAKKGPFKVGQIGLMLSLFKRY